MLRSKTVISYAAFIVLVPFPFSESILLYYGLHLILYFVLMFYVISCLLILDLFPHYSILCSMFVVQYQNIETFLPIQTDFKTVIYFI